jgi:hypothetical protein
VDNTYKFTITDIPTTRKILLNDCRTQPKHIRPKDACLYPTVAVSSYTVTADIRMIDIYCQSWLLSRFLTVIDDIIINGLAPMLRAIYTPLMQRSHHLSFYYSLKTFASQTCWLGAPAGRRYKPTSTHRSWRGSSPNKDQLWSKVDSPELLVWTLYI